MAETALAAPAVATATSGGTPVEKLKLTARQGATFRCSFESQDGAGGLLPLTGLHLRLEIGDRGGAARLTYDTADSPPQLQVDGALVRLYLGATITRTLPVGALQFDLDLYDPNDPDSVEPFVSGTLVVKPEVGS